MGDGADTGGMSHVDAGWFRNNNKKVKVIILEGAGKGFSAGHDLKEISSLKGKPDYEDALAGNVAAAAKVANQLGADIIVIGTAKVSSGGKFYNMTSGQADINGKIVRVDTGDILAVVTNSHGKKPHISPSTAGVNAMNEAAGKL